MNEGQADPSDLDHHLQALLDNVPDLIFFKDTDSRFTRVKRAYAAHVGAADRGAVIGRTDRDLFPAAAAREYLADEQRLLATGEALIGKPESHRGADGQTCWLLISKAPIHDRDGHIMGLVGIARDITELKQVEDDLRQSEWRHRDLLAEARRQAQELTLFDEVRTALAHELELHDLFRTVVEAIARTFGYTPVPVLCVNLSATVSASARVTCSR